MHGLDDQKSQYSSDAADESVVLSGFVTGNKKASNLLARRNTKERTKVPEKFVIPVETPHLATEGLPGSSVMGGYCLNPQLNDKMPQRGSLFVMCVAVLPIVGRAGHYEETAPSAMSGLISVKRRVS